MPFSEMTLIAARISSTAVQQLYVSPSSTTTVIKTIRVVNTSSASASFILYHDRAAATWTACTTLQPLIALNGFASYELSGPIIFRATATGTIALGADTSGVFTVYGYGAEVS